MATPSTDREAVTQIIRALKAAGYVLDYVNDGEESFPVRTETEALDGIFAVDEAVLYVDHPTERRSHVYFVLGNEPFEVACDYGVSLEPVMGPLTESWDQ